MPGAALAPLRVALLQPLPVTGVAPVGASSTPASRQALPEAHTPRLSLPAQHFPVAENWEGARPQVWGLNSPPDQLRVGASE